jgi:hypothetical protein
MTEQSSAVREQPSDPQLLVVEAALSMTADDAYRHWTDPQLLAQ